jgi:hypothetical protein
MTRKFEVEGMKRITASEIYECDTINEAADLFEAKHPELTLDVITDVTAEDGICHDYIGKCENCSIRIFGDDKHGYDPESDLLFCLPCINKSAEEVAPK